MLTNERKLPAAIDAQRDVVPAVIIENVAPELDGGRHPVKRVVGDVLTVSADIFLDGHDKIAACLRWRKKHEPDAAWTEVPMDHVDDDRWSGSFVLDENTRYVYTILAYADVWESWRADTQMKLEAMQDVSSDLVEGVRLIREAASRAHEADAELLRLGARQIDRAAALRERVRLALADELAALMRRSADRSRATLYDRELDVVVDRARARFSAWYEMFPRSQGRIPGVGATFKDCEARLPEVKAMGFDVVYLTPIHPIGRTNRKGKNNSLRAGPEDPGSPYAIGSEFGGHKAVEPSLGTLEDFDRFVAAARSLGMEVALDFAIQCSPDHPYVREHPEWFYHRADGTIKCAENPPKKYEDIYPINFDSPAWPEIWAEMRSVVTFWIDRGVKIFRVDNPHTKPFRFWSWLIADIQREHPEVIFLSEAFTRPKVMKLLAKAGFTQSYTYFTWRNFKEELTDYLVELTQSEMREYFRGHFFTNTPDILPTILQRGGRPAFKARLALAATLSSLYGMYNGYELCENSAVPGKEEYLNSEKYEFKVWDWDRPGNIKKYVTQINQIRNGNPALHLYDNLRYYRTDDDDIVLFGKMTLDRSNIVLVAVNLDPFQPHQARLHLPLADWGIAPGARFLAHELIADSQFLWKGAEQTIRLDPRIEPAAIFRITPWAYQDYESVSY